MKKLSASNADEGKAEISKTDAQTRIEKISAQSTEVMSGLVVISTSNKPIGKGGEVQVIMGWSSKLAPLPKPYDKVVRFWVLPRYERNSGQRKLVPRLIITGRKKKTNF